MKFLLLTVCISISCISMGQDSLSVIQKTEQSILNHLEKDRKCSMHDLSSVFSYYLSNNELEKLNEFFLRIFDTTNPEEMEIRFLQDFIYSSISLRHYLDEKNTLNLDRYYHSMRSRYSEFKENQQKILMLKSEMHFQRQQMEYGYAALTEVMKIYDSEIQTNDYLFASGKFNFGKIGFNYAYQAYISFLKHLPVDDYRFKMLAKDIRYTPYLNFNNQFAYQIINEKLVKAGYEKLTPKKLRGGVLDVEKIEKEKEEYKKKYDWIKKE